MILMLFLRLFVNSMQHVLVICVGSFVCLIKGLVCEFLVNFVLITDSSSGNSLPIYKQ